MMFDRFSIDPAHGVRKNGSSSVVRKGCGCRCRNDKKQCVLQQKALKKRPENTKSP
jgi:hypothetical protein